MFSKKSDLEKLAERQDAAEYDPKYDDDSGGVMAFIRNRGSRETFESILIAIVLALLFRNFLGEAYIIPTGSMAPALQGRHIDMQCEECGFQYRTGASNENVIGGVMQGEVRKTVCPICQNINTLQRRERRDHRSFAGDRILVNKFIYDFQTPNRWDVIVFKYPNNGKQNYIKRCVGIPGEGLLIEKGDIYTYDLQTESFTDRKIARKSHRKLQAMMQLVDDTYFIPEKLKELGWPSRWNQWENNPTWVIDRSGDHPAFSNAGKSNEVQWLRYRHLKPRISRIERTPGSQWILKTEWDQIDIGNLPSRLKDAKGELITDHYAYNESEESRRGGRIQDYIGMLGLHWVGDLGLECELNIASKQGFIEFDIVEGGIHFTCAINVNNGQATLKTHSPMDADSESGAGTVQFVDDLGNEANGTPSANTPVSGPGNYNIRFMNADDCLYLWVNNKPIEFEFCKYRREGNVVPWWTEGDALDAEPLGIGTRGVELKINRLKVVRDVYYVSANKNKGLDYQYRSIHNEYVGTAESPAIQEILRSPEMWQDSQKEVQGVTAHELFAAQNRDESWVFELNKYPGEPRRDEFMPMGDNSPQSSDARVWDGQAHVDREYLLGRAMYVYWPHAKTSPVPFWPNFERMKLIR